MYPTLSQSHKQRFPFRLSVPSFVYPADYATNVQRLGPFVDEIELLLLESRAESLPSEEEIDRLAALSTDLQLTYNVHLPLDLDLGSTDPEARRYAVERLAAAIERVHPLSPTTHTLHLTYGDKDCSPSGIRDWRARTHGSLTALLRATAVSPRRISIETLDYPPEWFAPLVDPLDLAVCVDAGHMALYGFDLQAVLDLFAQRITICHLHGVTNGKDHLSLDRLPPEARTILQRFLQSFQGSVSLEIFSFERLRDSLPCLVAMMDAGQGEPPPMRRYKER
jgi:sugar phosphate isomerase/epimerase